MIPPPNPPTTPGYLGLVPPPYPPPPNAIPLNNPQMPQVPNPSSLMVGLSAMPPMLYHQGLTTLPPYSPASVDPALLAAMSAMLLNPPPLPTQTSSGANPNDPDGQQIQQPQNPWKEHRTEEGRVFWHNTKTNKSTWDKPDELRTDMERILATSTSWREYPGGELDEKTYWHHLETKQSVWEVPTEVAILIEKMKELESEDWSDRKFDGKSAAKAAFKTFLERRGIGYKAKWEDIGKLLQSDPKWVIFDPHMTVGERKHIFNELVNQLIKKHKEEQRLKKANARDSLAEFLTKWKNGAPDVDPMHPDASYEDFEELASKEPWFHLLDSADKAEAFEDAAQSAAEDFVVRMPRQRTSEINRFFMDMEIPLTTPISEVIKHVQDGLGHGWVHRTHPLIILSAWQRYAQNQVEANRQRSKRYVYREERHVRKSFRQLLLDAESEGLVDAKSEWKDFLNASRPRKIRVLEKVPHPLSTRDQCLEKIMTKTDDKGETSTKDEPVTVKDDPSNKSNDQTANPQQAVRVCEDERYLRMFLQGGSTPRELFEDFVYNLWDVYEAIRPIVKSNLSATSALGQALSTTELSHEQFGELLLADQSINLRADSEIWIAANRPGVLTPLILSLAKRLRRSVEDNPHPPAPPSSSSSSLTINAVTTQTAVKNGSSADSSAEIQPQELDEEGATN